MTPSSPSDGPGGAPDGSGGPASETGAPPHDVVVDARGLRCPQPVIDLARAAASAAPGTTLRLLSTDPAAPGDVAAWCRMRGHELVDTATDGDHHVTVVRTSSR